MEESKNQTMRRSGVERDHVTMRMFCLLSRQGQKQDKKLEAQVFLACLLVPPSFVSLPCFCLVLEASVLGLTISFIIGRAESISKKVAVGHFE